MPRKTSITRHIIHAWRKPNHLTCFSFADCLFPLRFIPSTLMKEMELKGGVSVLNVLTQLQLKEDVSLLNGKSGFVPPASGYVWQPKKVPNGPAAV